MPKLWQKQEKAQLANDPGASLVTELADSTDDTLICWWPNFLFIYPQFHCNSRCTNKIQHKPISKIPANQTLRCYNLNSSPVQFNTKYSAFLATFNEKNTPLENQGSLTRSLLAAISAIIVQVVEKGSLWFNLLQQTRRQASTWDLCLAYWWRHWDMVKLAHSKSLVYETGSHSR